MHSNFSDGLFSPAELSPYYKAFGCDFRIQTDHVEIILPESVPAGKWLNAGKWDKYAEACRGASTLSHLCIPGAEIVWAAKEGGWPPGNWHHVRVWPRSGRVLIPEEAFKGLNFRQALLAMREAGLLVNMAHADQGEPLGQLDGAELDGIELRWDIEETRPVLGRESLKHWDRMLSCGRRVAISSGSDAHQPDLWAGSGFRTVLSAEPKEGSVLEALAQGRGYLAGTWHPDCYAELGFPERENKMAGGRTCFAPWWEFGDIPEIRDKSAREVAEAGFGLALKRGRCRREDLPVLADFKAGGGGCGEEIPASRDIGIEVAWRMHLPVVIARLIAAGRPVYEMPRSHPAYGSMDSGFSVRLDLCGVHYIRLELEAIDPMDSDKREVILSNPVYLI